jgi:hypothetical protein
LKSFPLDSTNIMRPRPLLINMWKGIAIMFFIEFFVDYHTMNIQKKRKKNHIICYVHHNEHCDFEIYYKRWLLLCVPSFNNENKIIPHDMKDEIQINLVRKNYIQF